MFWAVMVILLLRRAQAAPERAREACDCESYSLVSGDHDPVCGTDGLLYATSCLALCQGVGVAGFLSADPPCSGFDMGLAHPEHFEQKIDGAGVVDRHVGKGFRYLGTANRTLQQELYDAFERKGGVFVPEHEESEIGGGKFHKDGPMRRAWEHGMKVDIMYTHDGHVYGRRSSSSEITLDRPGCKSRESRKRRAGRKLAQNGNEGRNGSGGGGGQGGLSETQFLSVFGDNNKDDRAEVTDTNMDPYKRVGYIEPIGCTGSLVGPRHVITAAHCTFSLERRVWYPVTFKFSPGRTGGASPFGTIEYENIVAKGCFTSSGIPECDFAMIYLKESVGDETGFFGVGLDCDSDSVALNIAGYPSDKPDQTMWKETCGTAAVGCDPDPKIIVHSCDVVEGTSGSPLWDDNYNFRAIHKGAVLTRDLRYGNIAIYVTPFVHDTISQWINQG